MFLVQVYEEVVGVGCAGLGAGPEGALLAEHGGLEQVAQADGAGQLAVPAQLAEQSARGLCAPDFVHYVCRKRYFSN